VYLAGRYSRLDEFQGYKRELQEMGYKVPARWLLGEHRMIDGQPGPQNEGFALDDFADIHASDIVVAFTEEPRTAATRGGRHVEFGIALALHRYHARPALHVVGPKENVFYYMPGVVHHETWEAARCRLAVDAAGWLKGEDAHG